MWKHLLWIMPLTALVGWSLIQQARRPATAGQQLAAALQRQSVTLRAGVPLLEYRPAPAEHLGKLEVHVLGERMWVAAGTKVTVDLSGPWATRDVMLTIRGGGGLNKEVRPAGQYPKEAGAREVALRIIGNELTADANGAPVRITANDQPPLVEVEVQGPTYRWTRAPGARVRQFLAEKDAQREEQLLAALRSTGLGRSAAARELTAARESLAKRSDEELLVRLLSVSPAILEKCETPATAAEAALLLLACQPLGAALYFHQEARTVYIFTTREDTIPIRARVRCTAVCVDAQGHELWHGQMTTDATLPPEEIVPLVFLHAG